MPSACARMFGGIESLTPYVQRPSTSASRSPASATAAFTARAASVNTPTPESRENSVQPIPAMATCARGNRDVSLTSRRLRAVADAGDEAAVLGGHVELRGVERDACRSPPRGATVMRSSANTYQSSVTW